MTMQEKMARIGALTLKELQTVLCEMLQNDGCNCVIDETIIVAQKQGFTGPDTSIYICTTTVLSGKDNADIENIYNTVLMTYKKHSGSIIYIVSSQNISHGFVDRLKEKGIVQIKTIARDKFINLIDTRQPDFWCVSSIELVQYKQIFIQDINDDSDLRKLPIKQEKYKKMLGFFVNPRLRHWEEDKVTKKLVTKTYKVEELIDLDLPILLSGDAGSGKTTVLKHLGISMMDKVESENKLPRLPVFITALDLKNDEYDVKSSIQKKLKPIISEGGLGDLNNRYQLIVLIDSLDELEDKQSAIVFDLEMLRRKYKIRYIIATRNADSFKTIAKEDSLYDVHIRRFNYEQVTSFISRFFGENHGKADQLLESLKNNNIINKLPITPLSLSLISILFEENNYEIPATITDVYRNFSALILGRASVSQKVEFFDVSFKEKILSQYAYELLKRKDHMPMQKKEFYQYFTHLYEGKSIPLKKGALDDALDYLVKYTGILFLDKQENIQFSHTSYMEYYASLEIFNIYREEGENMLVDNFYDYNWQNTAIFYAGQTKDMLGFLRKINEKIQTASRLNEFFSSVGGCGYLLQALCFTDNELRKDVIINNLRLTIEIIEVFKKLAADDRIFYRDFKLPIINVFGLMFFYGSYKSVTLRCPLRMAFETLYEEYQKKKSVVVAYYLLELAFTLNSKAIGDNEPFDRMIKDRLVLNDSNLCYLTLLAMEATDQNYDVAIKDLKNEIKHLPPHHKNLLQQSISSLRFSDLNTIIPPKRVKLYVEGDTDAKILEHAYMVLTNGQSPYWVVTPAQNGDKNSCADSVAKVIDQAYAFAEPDICVIGIFDHDAAGLSAYKGILKEPNFMEELEFYIKKHRDYNIYGMLLPIPEDMQNYANKMQNLNFFAIEHYFGHDYLKLHNMGHEMECMPGIYQLHNGKKTAFAKDIVREVDRKVFLRFIPLFEQIDRLTGVHIDYE